MKNVSFDKMFRLWHWRQREFKYIILWHYLLYMQVLICLNVTYTCCSYTTARYSLCNSTSMHVVSMRRCQRVLTLWCRLALSIYIYIYIDKAVQSRDHLTQKVAERENREREQRERAERESRQTQKMTGRFRLKLRFCGKNCLLSTKVECHRYI